MEPKNNIEGKIVDILSVFGKFYEPILYNDGCGWICLICGKPDVNSPQKILYDAIAHIATHRKATSEYLFSVNHPIRMIEGKIRMVKSIRGLYDAFIKYMFELNPRDVIEDFRASSETYWKFTQQNDMLSEKEFLSAIYNNASPICVLCGEHYIREPTNEIVKEHIITCVKNCKSIMRAKIEM